MTMLACKQVCTFKKVKKIIISFSNYFQDLLKPKSFTKAKISHVFHFFLNKSKFPDLSVRPIGDDKNDY